MTLSEKYSNYNAFYIKYGRVPDSQEEIEKFMALGKIIHKSETAKRKWRIFKWKKMK